MESDMEHDTRRYIQRGIGSTESRLTTLRGQLDFNEMDHSAPSNVDLLGQWSAPSLVSANDERTTSHLIYANPGRPEVVTVGSGWTGAATLKRTQSPAVKADPTASLSSL